MTINTTYSRSISLSRTQMSKLLEIDMVLVKQKHSDIPLARLNAKDIYSGAKQVMIEDRHGNTKLSPYYVYKF